MNRASFADMSSHEPSTFGTSINQLYSGPHSARDPSHDSTGMHMWPHPNKHKWLSTDNADISGDSNGGAHTPTPTTLLNPHMACMSVFTTPLLFPSVRNRLLELPSPFLPSPFISAAATTKNVAHLQPGRHVLMLVVHGNKTYHVLLLSPPLQMPFDHILPPPDAFCAAGTPVPSYSIFKMSQCTWQGIFGMIAHPELLWNFWAPKSLGSYMSIELLWEMWEEGELVKGIGHGPPLRLVDSEWGWCEDQRMEKGKLPAWWPCNNEQVSVQAQVNNIQLMASQVRKHWLQFSSLVARIQQEIANGKTTSATVRGLNNFRAGRILPQLQVALHPKHAKKNAAVSASPLLENKPNASFSPSPL